MVKYYFALILCLYVPAALCLSKEMQELMDMLHGTCVAESGVSEDVIARVNTEKKMIDDAKLKCYIKCLLTQMASISDDGVVDVEATVALLPEEMKEVSTPIIRKCGAKIGANPCESAWLTHKCYLESNPDVSFQNKTAENTFPD